MRILVAAPANPVSTSAYYVRALRRTHEVRTCGPALDDAMLSQWGQWERHHELKRDEAGQDDKIGLLRRLVRPCDIPMPWGCVDTEHIPLDGWQPELVIWIDAGGEFTLAHPDALGCPSVCIMGDTHTDDTWRLPYAANFDHVFLQFNREHVARYWDSCPHVSWLPAACDPEIHCHAPVDKAYDVVFIGQTMREWHPDRVRLLELLRASFDVRVDSRIMEEMALLHSRGRIVFNRSLAGDLNMRVPEALASGSLLLTDRLGPESGMDQLYSDREDLVLYDEDNLEETVRYYLANEAEREAIAEHGRDTALAWHTYDHRVEQMMDEVFPAALEPAPLPVVVTGRRALVFNWHEPYICLLAATGYEFDVAPPECDQDRPWRESYRALPDNVSPVSFTKAQTLAQQGAYDIVICLTLQDVETVQAWPGPRLYIVLNMLGTESGMQGAEKEAYKQQLLPLFADVDVAFSSEKKRREWGWDALVVSHGIDPDDYGPYTGEVARVLRVGNGLRERDYMQGWSIQEEILAGLPSTIIGTNPDLDSRPATDPADMKRQYSTHRVLLSTLSDEHEDGYNLAVLEAMASGMPVVCLANSSTPIIDGVNGFVSPDLAYLKLCLVKLLRDQDLAKELGARGRETVAEHFHISDCAAGWERVFTACIERSR